MTAKHLIDTCLLSGLSAVDLRARTIPATPTHTRVLKCGRCSRPPSSASALLPVYAPQPDSDSACLEMEGHKNNASRNR
jgi:hypothetical protein